ncbi:hypothetical protein [Streptomyces clavuligerus]|uniref:Uncharacterized protein n=1 Tax=Streptomyces clavuligerus TaxID=1901 RepID=B5H0X1_STRCL|nr:hypothetical protein [Streptomyces clavuligerus]ANW20853.1 hypothetical protein BB341_22885 [Streptomyces clavuligerus]AXU15478.1 hypothetical protein D1794_23790 [Streptomyces clavuligerus]EDY52217.1 hypothetical protein SSCG_05211 [Streptomyces clavuligerus]EFG06100.1 Hypothetical protein SCLAV_1022 [Streptomyces clavuligerus]MBY6305576.1 hypothetical protein [Streptomyces clavuligerus]
MPARTPSAVPAGTGRSGARLSWWSLALPILAFTVLLGLMADPAEAGTAQEGSAVRLLVEYLHRLLIS